jgi:CheY-like chemotaxis protein
MQEGEHAVVPRNLILSERIASAIQPSLSFLRRSLWRILSVRTGSEALSLAGASDPILMVLDFDLPGPPAGDICRRIRESPTLKDVPVVILGPPAPGPEEQACRESGCTLYLPDSIGPEILLARLASLLDTVPRRHPRLSVVLSVSYGTVTTRVLGRSRDLSLGGIQVRTATRLRKGYYINLRFAFDSDERPVSVLGQIVRALPSNENGGRFDVGIRFTALSDEARRRIEAFLARPPVIPLPR